MGPVHEFSHWYPGENSRITRIRHNPGSYEVNIRSRIRRAVLRLITTGFPAKSAIPAPITGRRREVEATGVGLGK